MAKKRTAPRSRSTGQKIAAELVKQAGSDAIYIGPWLLFRRVAGASDAKHAFGWIRESIAEAIDAELSASKGKSHSQTFQRTRPAGKLPAGRKQPVRRPGR